MSKRNKGFSLIELLVAMAVIGVLAAIAIPTYQQYLLKGNQSGAKAVLLDIAQKQPQYLADRRSTYANSLADLSITVPADVAELYDYTIVTASPPPSYIATATPKTAAAAKVGTTWFRITSSGNKEYGVGSTTGGKW